jgi:hypothetical protein
MDSIRRPGPGALHQQQAVRALIDGLDAGTAEAVDGDGGHFNRQAGLEADVARAVDGVARSLQGVAEDDVVEVGRRHAAALDGAAGGNCA